MESPEHGTQRPSRPARIARDAALGACVVGGVGFVCGFLGPIALSPEANQGPLLGIFITGPAGAIAGALLGAVTGALRVSPAAFRSTIAIACTIAAATTLLLSTPQPQFRASILDAEIRGCAPPRGRRDETIARWEDALARTTYAQPRAGWKEDFDRMLANESAVVLELRVLRQSSVYEKRKPWNLGDLEARPSSSQVAERAYFATYAGGSCDSYPTGTQTRFLATGATSHEWPPEILANLLDLQTVEPAPEPYASLAR